MGKASQKQRKQAKKNKQANLINAEIDQTDDQTVCWICYAKLTKKNTQHLGCGHDDYCKSCIKKWADDKSKPFVFMACAESKTKKEQYAMTFFNGDQSFSCPTCRVKHTYCWPSFDGKNDGVYPSRSLVI